MVSIDVDLTRVEGREMLKLAEKNQWLVDVLERRTECDEKKTKIKNLTSITGLKENVFDGKKDLELSDNKNYHFSFLRSK